MRNLIFFTTFFFIAASAYPQNYELVTDRPDQTESSVTVPLKSLQIESGLIYESDDNGATKVENITFNSTLLRYGLMDNFEIRMGVEYLKQKQSHESISGFGPIYFGTKTYIRPEKGILPEMSLLTSITLPGIGKKEFRPGNMGSEIRFSLSHTLSKWLSIGYNFGAEWNGTDPSACGIYSFVCGMSASKRLGLFIESYGYLPENDKPDHRADAGLTYLIIDNLQLDGSAGIKLMKHSTYYFINFGFAWLFAR